MAVPVILHFLMRGKPRQYEFPAIRFVQNRKMQNQRRFRLRHLLLLALRMLILALLGLALARPTVRFTGSMGSQEAPIAAAVVVDTAPRMDYTQGNQTRLDATADLGQWIIRRLPKDSRVAVVDGRRSPATFQVDMKAAGERLERLSTNASARTLSQSIAAALELLERSELTRREIYIFTDMAATAWSTDVAPVVQERAARLSDLGVYVIDVGARDPINMGIERLDLSQQAVTGGGGLLVDVDVAQWNDRRDRAIELLVDGRSGAQLNGAPLDDGVMSGRRTVEFAEGEDRKAFTFPLAGLDVGLHQGVVQLTGQDGLSVDDRRCFTFEVRSAYPILIVAPEPIDEHALFVREALAPSDFVREGIASFQCDVIPRRELSGRLDRATLDKYAAVLLLDPAPLSDEDWTRLQGWVESGRGLGVFLGRRASDVDSFNTAAAQKLLAAPLKRHARAPDGDVFLSPIEYENPVLAPFRRFDETVPWPVSPVFRYWELGDPHKGVNIAAPLSDGRPAILTRSVGRGRVLMMTTPISDLPSEKPWNWLPVSDAAWPFFVLSDGMAHYLVGAGEQDYNYLAGQSAVLRLPTDRLLKSYVLRKPDGVDIRVQSDLESQALRVTSTDEVGNYAIRSGADESSERLGFSVNYAPAQIDMTRMAPEQLAAVLGETPYQLARDREGIEVGVSRGRVGRELYPLIILLVVVFVGCELLLSNRFYKR